jgi:hypothetical protein
MTTTRREYSRRDKIKTGNRTDSRVIDKQAQKFCSCTTFYHRILLIRKYVLECQTKVVSTFNNKYMGILDIVLRAKQSLMELQHQFSCFGQ